MCYWVGSRKIREALYKHFQENPDDEIAQLYYETFLTSASHAEFPLQEHWVAIGKSRPGLSAIIREGGNCKFKNLQWGLEWSYTHQGSGETHSRELLNSTCEKVFWHHRDIIFNKRCIVPADGYYEFYHFRGNTYPYFLFPKDRSAFYLGGIWDSRLNTETGEIRETLSLITTPPNELTGRLHNNPQAPNGPRMLLIIPPAQAAEFLNDELNQREINAFFKPFPAAKMDCYPTVRFLKKEYASVINTSAVQEPFHYPELVA